VPSSSITYTASPHANPYLIDLLDDLHDLTFDPLYLLGIPLPLDYPAHYVSDAALLGYLHRKDKVTVWAYLVV
jgi:hypothetical protein